MNTFLFNVQLKPVYRDNDNDAWIPENWANESLAILEENMVAVNLVHRDFEDEIAAQGDVVNTRKPNEFKAKRKDQKDAVTVQDAKSTNIPVPLNQHLHTTFIVYDKEMSLAFADLVDEYLRPALLSIAQAADKIVLCQAPRYIRADGKTAGTLGTNLGVNAIVDTMVNFNNNKAPMMNRNFIITARDHGALMKLDQFTSAEKIGDEGTALRTASLGQTYGFNFFMAQNTPDVPTSHTDDTEAGAINNAAGYGVGIKTFTVDTFTSAITVGTWIVIAGNDVPQRVTASTGSPATSITVAEGLKNAVVDNAAITAYLPGAVNLAAGYANGWLKEIVLDGFGRTPDVGQMVSFLEGTPTGAEPVYCVIDSDDTAKTVLLDRPLETAVADNAVVAIGPAGGYNFAFTRNALAFVNRPLATPPAQAGAASAVANFNNISIRVVWQYDGNLQGMRVTVDMLCGIAILDQDLGEACVS